MKSSNYDRTGPALTVDVIIELPDDHVVLVQRRFPPIGWALFGGFVDVGESLEEAAVREAREETGLDVTLTAQLRAYSDPARDPRRHTVTVVFVGVAEGELQAGDDASDTKVCSLFALPAPLCFDHEQILQDYIRTRDQAGLVKELPAWQSHSPR